MMFLNLHKCYTRQRENRINKGITVIKAIKKVRKEIKTTQLKNQVKTPVNAVFMGVLLISALKLKVAKNG